MSLISKHFLFSLIYLLYLSLIQSLQSFQQVLINHTAMFKNLNNKNNPLL